MLLSTKIPCVILAGGKSSRMGEDKCFLPFSSNNTLIQYQYERLSKIFSKVYISSKTNKFNFNANLILDDTTNISSPMIALHSILTQLDDKKVFIISVDTPLVEEQTISHIIDSCKDYDITIAKDNNKIHTLCGIYSKNILTNIKMNIKNDIHKINHLIQHSNHLCIKFDNSQQFININTQKDYKELKNIK